LDYSFLIESEGIEAARQATLMNNEDPDTYDIMGLIYLKMNNYVNAERFFIEANKLSPYSSKTLLHLGQLYLLKNEKNLAFFYLTNAVDYAQNEVIKNMALKLLEEIN
jgi:Flp pilus assembly protein TadD